MINHLLIVLLKVFSELVSIVGNCLNKLGEVQSQVDNYPQRDFGSGRRAIYQSIH